jgi:outer membrane protein assembly factor BamB
VENNKKAITMKNLIIIFLTCFWSCEKESNLESKDSLKILWKSQLGPTLFDQIAQDPALYKDNLIFGYQTEFENGYYILNKNTGKLTKDIKMQKSFEPFSVIDGAIYYSNFSEVAYRTINLDTYEIKYHNQDQGDYTFIGVLPHKENLYSSSFPFGNTPKNKVLIKRAPVYNPALWETVYINDFVIDGDVSGSVSGGLNFEIDHKGDEIMYFASVKSFTQAAKKGKYKVSAFNLSKKKLEWETEEFELDIHHNNSLGRNSIITETQFIVSLGSTQLMSFDKKTGKLLWSTSIIDMTFTNYYEKNGKISFLTDNGVLHMVDASSGKVISKKDGFIGNTKGWQFHKGIMYFTTASGKLYGVDAETHKIELELSSPNLDNCSYCNFFLQSPVVDPNTDRLYITDGKEVICYQLPK